MKWRSFAQMRSRIKDGNIEIELQRLFGKGIFALASLVGEVKADSVTNIEAGAMWRDSTEAKEAGIRSVLEDGFNVQGAKDGDPNSPEVIVLSPREKRTGALLVLSKDIAFVCGGR